jgi:molybdopterin/thiamine biosynthesis adenylyltransferase
MQTRYIKNQNAISEIEQQTLSKKNVAIVGCGGLGQYTASLLARLGICRLTIIDFDVFDETNLNRQQFATVDNIGKYKVSETQGILHLINPDVVITPHITRFTEENGASLLSGHDLVIDALDSIPDRLLLQKVCKDIGIILISAAVGGWYGQLMVIRPGDDTLREVYKNIDSGDIVSELGCPAFLPSLMASLQVAEAVKYLLSKGNLAEKKVLYIDLSTLLFERY